LLHSEPVHLPREFVTERLGRFSKADVVIWLHGGGAPGVFAYPAAMARAAAPDAVDESLN
jgi:hypothetical protein